MFDAVRSLQRSRTLALALSPVGVLLIAASRLLIVSDYKVTTATAIVTSDGYLNTLLGSLIPVVPLFIPYLALVLLFSRRFIVGLLALLAAVLVSPTMYSGMRALRLVQANATLAWEWSRSRPHALIFVPALIAVVLLIFNAFFGVSALSRTLGVLLVVAAVPLVLQIYSPHTGRAYYVRQLRQPWLPEERISLRGQPGVLGYVLSDSNVSLEVLRDADRSVVFYSNGLVVGQQICQATEGLPQGPLLPLTPLRHPAPTCELAPPPRPPTDRGAENPRATESPSVAPSAQVGVSSPTQRRIGRKPCVNLHVGLGDPPRSTSTSCHERKRSRRSDGTQPFSSFQGRKPGED